jgi:hypothetical protein
VVSFIPPMDSTSDRLHSEFVRLLFLQAHRETDRFFTVSGVQFPPTHPGGQFHFRRAAFLTQLKRKVGLVLTKASDLRINLNLDGAPITSKSHTHPSVNLLVYSLSLHRHSYIGFILSFVSSIHNKLKTKNPPVRSNLIYVIEDFRSKNPPVRSLTQSLGDPWGTRSISL